MTRTVLITGGSSGIGRAIAERFAADQATVIITGRYADTVKRTASELGAHGVVCDSTDPRQVAALGAHLGKSLDVLVNAAGGLPDDTGEDLPPLERLLAEWSASLSQNLLGSVLTTAAVEDKLVAGSTVLSIGSIGAERRGGSYGAAKAALATWNATISAQLGPHGICANVISPGFVAGTNFFGAAMTASRYDALVHETHNKRAGTPADIAETAFFLASAGARHITGQTIHVNGGAFTTR
jgi:3-oxoacyl-[acyl-carrier protein] reductase